MLGCFYRLWGIFIVVYFDTWYVISNDCALFKIIILKIRQIISKRGLGTIQVLLDRTLQRSQRKAHISFAPWLPLNPLPLLDQPDH